jgi:hypothetical protein
MKVLNYLGIVFLLYCCLFQKFPKLKPTLLNREGFFTLYIPIKGLFPIEIFEVLFFHKNMHDFLLVFKVG